MAIFKAYTLDKVFRALGDATRRDMLSMLAKSHHLNASQLAEPFAITQPTASKHLKVLERAALITRTIEGRTHYFNLKPETLSTAEVWIHRHREFWLGSFGRLGQLIQSLPSDKDT